MKKIKELREKAGMTKEMLAEQAGVSVELIKLLEDKGRCVNYSSISKDIIDKDSLQRIADVLHCGIEDCISPLALKRIRLGITVRELSERINVPARTLYAYEREERPVDGMKYERLKLYAEALRCHIDDIVNINKKEEADSEKES